MTRVRVVGAGIAGLTAALALHEAGLRDIVVHERSPVLGPLGSGLNLMPQATGRLAGLGVLPALERVAVATRELQLTTARGQVLWRELRGAAAGSEHPQLSVHRGWLTQVLADVVRERLGPGALRTGERLVDADPDAGIALFADPAGAVTEAGFDVLVGADGIRSTARRVVTGEEVALHHAGATISRGVVDAPSFLDGATMVIAGDGVRKVVFYPLQARPGGRCLMNWAAATPAASLAEHGSWNATAEPSEFAEEFAGWRIHGVDVRELMLATAQPFAYPMVDIDPLPSWTRGGIVLVGDAAHAMYPIGSNGATQSVIDAAVLGRALGDHADSGPALAAYEAERLPAAVAVQRANRLRGPEVVIDIAAERAPDGFADVADVFEPGELESIAARYAATTGASTPARSHR